MWSKAVVAKIHDPSEYYFITSDRAAQGFFTLYSSTSVTVSNDNEIRKNPGEKVVRAFPRSYIKELNLTETFYLKIRITQGSANQFEHDKIPLSDILTPVTFADTQALSLALITAGMPSIDFGDALIILSAKMATPIPKVHDENVKTKLTTAMNEALMNAASENFPAFTIEGNGYLVRVWVCLTAEARDKFTSAEVGVFRYPAK